jgi:hypothetical protein
MIGTRFHRLTFVSEPYSEFYSGRKRRMVDAICDCGFKMKVTYSPSNQYPRSCANCKSLIFEDRLKAKKMRSSWAAMKRRCNDETGKHFPYYKARGITYCDRWEKFSCFYADMQDTWFIGSQLDRYPNTKGNYEPSNCRWVTPVQQQRNKECVRVSESTVEEIRRLYSTGKYTQKQVGDMYGIRDNTVSRIVNFKRWK